MARLSIRCSGRRRGAVPPTVSGSSARCSIRLVDYTGEQLAGVPDTALDSYVREMRQTSLPNRR